MPEEKFDPNIDPLRDAEQSLREKGIDDDDILTGSSDEWEEARQWWQCRQCKAYINVRVKCHGKIEGGPDFFMFVDVDSTECPHCSCPGGKFDTVEPPDNPFFDKKLPKYDAKVLENSYAWATKWLRLAKSMISDSGFFPPDVHGEKEPQWPKDLAAVILASEIVGLENDVDSGESTV